MSFLDLFARIILSVLAATFVAVGVMLGRIVHRWRSLWENAGTSGSSPASMSPRRGGNAKPRLTCAATVVVLVGCLLPFEAAAEPAAGSDRIQVAYVRPAKAAYREIYNTMRERWVLERVGAIVGLVRLPTRLTYRLKECAGELNAWYAPEDRSVTLCYELVDSIVRAAPKTRSSTGVTRQDAIQGPIFQILLHESGHALFDLLQVPILGREEDAADQVASLILLHLAPADARMAVSGGGYYFATAAKDEPADKGAFADVHGLSWQRFYNLACMAYGSDRRRYRAVVTKGYLTKDRAEGCGEEYDQVAFAVRKLIGPHLRLRPGGGERLRHAFRSAATP